MTHTYWVLGPIAWDTVVEVAELPQPGGFTQAAAVSGRPGGSGANVAVGLASAGVDVRMVGYVGRDDRGRCLLASLAAAGVDTDHVSVRAVATSHVLILLDGSGERTMVGVAPDELAEVPVPVDAARPRDVLYAGGWRPAFAPQLRRLLDRGVTVVSVPAEDGSVPPARYIVGSEQQLGGVDPAADRRYRQALRSDTVAIVITHGRLGARVYTRDGDFEVSARDVEAVDTTGAGDSFAAGVMLELGRGGSVADAVRVGTDWAGLAVSSRQSWPPPWSSVVTLDN
jgi:sugar/nucleoside kinase (ribokinase family)